MPESTEEIAVRLGLSESDFITGIRDAEEAVRRFKKEGDKTKDEGNGLMQSIKQTNSAFVALKATVFPLAIAMAVRKFYSEAIEGARNYKGATDENIEGAKRLGDRIDNLMTTMQTGSAKSLGAITRFAEFLRGTAQGYFEMANGTTKAWEDGETALAETEKSLREVTKEIGEQKKLADEHKKLNQEMETLRKKEADQNLKKLSDLEQLNALENRRAAIMREIEGGQLTRIELHRAEVALMETQVSLDEKSAAYYEKTVAEKRKENEDLRAAKLAELNVNERQVVIEREILDIQALLGSDALRAADREYFIATLKTRQLELTKAQVEEHKKLEELSVKDAENYAKRLDEGRQEVSLQEKRRSILAEQAKIKELIAKSDVTSKEHAFYLTRQEQLRVAALETEKGLKSNAFQIAELLLKSGDDLNEVEKEKLKLLKGETTEAKQLAEVQILTAKLIDGVITPAEKDRLRILIGQTEQVKAQNSNLKDQLRILFSIRGATYDSQSNKVLEENIARLQKSVTQRAQYMWEHGGQYDPYYYIEKTQLEDAKKELSTRKGVQRLVTQYGSEEEAYKHWGGSAADFEKGMQYSSLTPEDSRNLENLGTVMQRIDERLRRSGIFEQQ